MRIVPYIYFRGDEPDMRKVLSGLSEGGEVSKDLEKMYWGDIFGSLIDKFGVEWMMNISG
ncbi:MAG TPA: hypothetical protein VFN51_03900 [Candidatus Saccharimonadales bacterium]|nr:hypothetical protein [Candidatus Saccharimonadales bacterium]